MTKRIIAMLLLASLIMGCAGLKSKLCTAFPSLKICASPTPSAAPTPAS